MCATFPTCRIHTSHAPLCTCKTHALFHLHVCALKAVALGSRKRKRTSQHSAPPAPLLSPLLVPCVDPWQAGSGQLLAALRVCGAVFVRIREDVFSDDVPDFPAWHRLWRQAIEEPTVFYKRGIVRSRQLRFSKGEDLLRTRVGEGKAHTPDVRYNFGLGKDALRSKAWGVSFALFMSCGMVV